MSQDTDTLPIDEAIAVVQDARERAPADFLVALAVILGSAALALFAAAAVTGGALQDLLLNLGVELIGALLTVVLIDGLWKRLEAGASATLEAMGAELVERRTLPISDEERLAWRVFVDEYRAIVRAQSLLDRVFALPAYRRRMRALEAQGNRTLGRFARAASSPSRSPQ